MYEKPEMDLIEISVDDIVRTSPSDFGKEESGDENPLPW